MRMFAESLPLRRRIDVGLNESSDLPGASGNCGKCGIEAPGGVQLIYWQPDAGTDQSNQHTHDSQIYTQVQDGFTL